MKFRFEDTIDAMIQAELECDDDLYIPGCGEDDTTDSRGEPLRPKYNEAGEPWWM